MKEINSRQANFTLPSDIIEELRHSVPRGEQSRVVADALRRELKRLRFRRALENSFGAWQNEDHQELEQGTKSYIRQSRRSSRAMD